MTHLIKTILFLAVCLPATGISQTNSSSLPVNDGFKRDIPSYDWHPSGDKQNDSLMQLPCMPPNPTNINCGQVIGFNLDANGYVGGNPTSGNSGCNPCCYSGSDLDCDGVQDVSYSVENSEWFKYCNSTCPLMTATICADEIGSGSSCNIQGAVWVGAAFNSTTLDCGNSQYQEFGSNPGGGADGFCFTVSVPNGQCAYFMVDGYGGATCSSVSVSVTCPPCCVTPTVTTTQVNVNCNGQCTGTATATGSGATAPYTYVWNTSPVQSTQTATGLCSGTYSVTVTDALGCTKVQAVTITQPPVLTASASGTNLNCNGVCTGSASVTAGGGTPAYTYAWSPSGGNSSAATGLCAGNYTVIVTDSKGCTKTTTVSITQPPLLTASIGSSTSINCNGVCTGTANVTAGGGTPAYTYAWSPSGGNSSAATGLCAGNYTVTVTDSKGCTKTTTVSITQPPLLTASIGSSTSINCNGVCTGTANVTAGGGTPAYTYAWSPSGGNSSSATGLCAGNYTVTVTDSKGCTKTTTVSITQPAILTASIGSSTSINCNGVCTGTANVTAGGGTPAYTYAWSPSGGNSSSATGLCAGNYTVTVTDSKGCTKTTTVSITQPAALTSTASATNPNCNGGTGSACVTAGGGTPAYTYAWNPSGGNSSCATGLSAGNYTVTVTDSKGCTKTATVSITQPPVLTASIGSSTSINCNGGTGSACVTAGGGNPAYTYAWNPSGGNSSCATGLSAGNYTATVTDANGCTKTTTISIAQPTALSISVTPTTATCGNNNGSASASVSGGNPAYTYSWSNGQTTTNATGLIAGTYTLTVTDASGCTLTALANISNTGSPTANISPVQNVSCNGGSNGSLTANVTSGTSPFTYSWNSGQTTSAITGLPAGNYQVTITDGAGCIVIVSVTISEPSALTSTVTPTLVSCNGGNNGSATISTSGGTLNYTYAWSPSGGTSSTATGLSAGNYTVTITDGNNCTATATTTLSQPTAVTATISSTTTVSCNGGNNGDATAVGGGGNPGYTYSWNPSGQTNSTATGLTSGNYTVTITDATNCTSTATVNISQPAALTSSITATTNACNGGNNGDATVTGNGGTPSYTYSWNNGQTSATATGLLPGNYTATVTDGNGCTSTAVATVTNSGIIANIAGATTICSGTNATLTASGGTNYSWSTGATTSSITVTGTATATYSVIVTNGICGDTSSATITVAPSVTASVSGNAAICTGDTVTLTASGGTNYSWNTGATTSSITVNPSSTTNYSVTVTSGICSDNASTTVTVNPLPTITISGTTTVCSGSSATLTASGGNNYSWNTGATTSSITVTPSANTSYTVTVTDANSCSGIDSIMIVIDSVTAVAPSQFICKGASATLTASGGNNYSWSTGGTTASIIVSPTTSTNYTVNVSDGICGDTAVVTVNVLSTVVASISGPDTICIGSSATLTASGGTNYVWNTGATTTSITISPTSATTYSVVVSISSCMEDTSFFVTVIPSPTVTVSSPATICLGDNTTLTASGGGNYSWSDGSTTSSIVVTPTTTTNYTVTVTNANGCTDTASVLVTTTPNINPTVTPSAICAGDSALLTASGGGTYAWSTGATTSSIYASPTTTTSYTVTVTNGICNASAVATVTVTAGITAIISGQTSLCPGGSTTLSVSGGSSFSWSTGATTTSIVVTPSSSSTYSVITSSSSCSDTATVTVTVNSLPVITIAGPDTVCAGQLDSLFATGGVSYIWNTGDTNDTILIAPTVTTNYSLTATDGNGCTNTASFTVVTSPNIVTTVNPSAICPGDSALLTATGGGNYLWSTGATTSSIVVYPTSTTSYSVDVTNGFCTASAIATVTVTGSITATISGPNSICAGSSITLTASGGSSFSWSTGATTASITISPTGNTSYTVTVGSASCSDDTSITVTVNPLPTPVISGATPICLGASTTLSVTGGNSFLWSNGATTSSIILSPTSNSTYTVTVTDANGCSDTTSANVSVSSVTATVSNSTTICSGTSATLSATGGTNYSWSNGLTASSINVNPSATTNYTVVVSDAGGCSDTAITTVTVSPPPTASISGNVTICAGDAVTLSASGGGNYLWNPTGQTTAFITVNPASTTTYSVIVSVGNCSDTATASVNVNAGPTASAGTDITINIGSSTTLSGAGGGTYSWSPTTGLSCSDCQSPVANPNATTEYCLFVTDAGGCDDSSCVTIYVEDNLCKPIYLPNAFSPNDDFENDVLYVYGTCIKEMKLIIYSRWGEKVYDGTDQAEGWNGIYDGKMEDSAVFTYYLTYTLTTGESGDKKGNVSLVR